MSLIQTITVLICLSALFSYLNQRWLKLPLTIGLMAIALVFSLGLLILGKLGLTFEQEAEEFVRHIDFNETVLHGMLALLLFAGALHVDLNELLDRKWFILTLASVGVLLSTLIVGVLTFFLFAAIGLPLPFLGCLVFGALISPTDPIAVMGILRQARVPRALEIKIAGESLFNDGVAVVAFLVLLGMWTSGEASLGEVTLLFVQEAVGGTVIGLAAGYATYRMLKSVDQHQVEILLTLALAMGSYVLADAVHASGPIAVVVAGLLIGNHGRRFAMSDSTLEYLDTFWELIDELLNAILFVLIGLEVLVLSFLPVYLEAALLAIPVVLLARWLSVGLPVQFFRSALPFSERATLIMTWGGLRGGVSVALALSLPDGSARDALLTITYCVVAFSILVQGLTLGRLVARKPSPAAVEAEAQLS